ncbi:MAG: hypothetical protein QXH56_08655 [Thermoprotei archaeon]
MSSATGRTKVAAYYKRGGRPLTIEEIEHKLALHPFLPPPQHVIILDGDVRVAQRVAVGMTPAKQRVVVLTPIADDETVLHETLHSNGLKELGAQIMSRILTIREKLVLFPRRVRYEECGGCTTHITLLKQYGLQPEDGVWNYPKIKHYYLVES